MALLKNLAIVAATGLIPHILAKHVHFDLDLTWQKGAPDGNLREMIFMNNQFPGPELRLEQGDDVEVSFIHILQGKISAMVNYTNQLEQFVVHNNLPFNTTVHFHGIEQKNTPWSDGVPGLSQKPIQPGHSWTYRWTATQYGTYWYHAHGMAEIMDGLYGPIWIK